jgi:hypothetical protein
MHPQRGLPLTEAAKRMGLSTIALRRRVQRGTVEAYKGGDRWYVIVPDNEVPVTEPVRTAARASITPDDAAVAALREELALLRGKVEAIPTLERELEARAREMTDMRTAYERQISELHILLQTSQQNEQRLLSATVPDAPESAVSARETQDSKSGVADEKTSQRGADEEPAPSAKRRGLIARLFGLE